MLKAPRVPPVRSYIALMHSNFAAIIVLIKILHLKTYKSHLAGFVFSSNTCLIIVIFNPWIVTWLNQVSDLASSTTEGQAEVPERGPQEEGGVGEEASERTQGENAVQD